ncbi:MAG: secB [Rickettsiaceae bacterium]|jgi:preprotein translocase subunit SecB|nr:secB [Rickettsiaceae bacterium]
MTNKKSSPSNNNTDANRQVVINAQYVKDLSFENPGAPENLVGKGDAPKIDVSVDIQVKALAEKAFEVVLVISAGAKLQDKSLFLAELSYGGVFTVDVPEEEKEPVLMIYCPGMLFPYARRVLSDAVRDGGFPPLMLDPIDFASLFHQHKTLQAKQQTN